MRGRHLRRDLDSLVFPLLFGRLHIPEVGPEYIRTKAYPDLVRCRVFAVSGRNKFVGLYLPFLICAKVVTSIVSAAHLRPNGGFTPRCIHSHTAHVRY